MKSSSFPRVRPVGWLALSLAFAAGVALAQERQQADQRVGEMTIERGRAGEIFKEPSYSPYAGRRFPTQVFWGDTHLHTSNSLDARAFGVILDPEADYRFARGEEVTSSHGIRVKLSRPLAFLVVADHSDGLGAMNEIIAGNPALLRDPTVKNWNERINQGGETALMATMDVISDFSSGNIPEVLLDEKFAESIWDRYLKTAEAFNEPGRFTTIIGYEWTSTEDGNNLHRNVLYRDGADLARRTLPYTTSESFNPEDLWTFGKHAGVEPGKDRWEHIVGEFGSTRIVAWEMAASGYAGVWATENSRDAIFDALERKEVYATTGPRMIVRFFGGWDFVPEHARTRLPAEIGYTKGVPMGGELTSRPEGKSPSFMVAAAKDPYSGNLDRIQIVKGWVGADGKTGEKVYDAVWSGDRQPNADGKLPAVGDTVDRESATWTNSIGAPELIVVWEDPDFDPAVPAFHYARVIEIPTACWTAYDAKRYGATMPPEVPMKGQERAYTSPIWYRPGG